MYSFLAPSSERMISSSLRWSAFALRFWLFWMTKTIQNVTTVVPVLITSCHVSEKWNKGPVSAQTATTRTEAISAQTLPSASLIESAARLNRSRHAECLQSRVGHGPWAAA